MTGPRLPLLRTRQTVFESTVASTAEYLSALWPDELSDLQVEIAALPHSDPNSASSSVSRPASDSDAHADAARGGVRRWMSFPAEKRIVLYRLPIERLSRLHRNDDLHRRMMVESCVFRAVAELLGKDPWDLAPERFRHH